MPQATRDIKRRIKSITSTKKITKAMELVSAAKMRKAVSSVLGTRSYARLAWALVKKLAQKGDARFHKLLQTRKDVKKVGLLLVTSNRGMCGGFNAQIIQKSIHYIKNFQEKGIETEVIVLGKKGADFMAKRGFNLAAEFTKQDVNPDIVGIRPLAKLLIGDYLAGKYDKVGIAFTDFVSTLAQKPKILEILPLKNFDSEPNMGEVFGASGKEVQSAEDQSIMNFEYLFEPTPKEVLNNLLPRLLEMEIYQSILESDASEHSARMVAMRNASDAATDMIDGLTLAFNKARQASITNELADISGGRAAVE